MIADTNARNRNAPLRQESGSVLTAPLQEC